MHNKTQKLFPKKKLFHFCPSCGPLCWESWVHAREPRRGSAVITPRVAPTQVSPRGERENQQKAWDAWIRRETKTRAERKDWKWEEEGAWEAKGHRTRVFSLIFESWDQRRWNTPQNSIKIQPASLTPLVILQETCCRAQLSLQRVTQEKRFRSSSCF